MFKDVINKIIDFIFYAPNELKSLREENKELGISLGKQYEKERKIIEHYEKILKEIKSECKYNMQVQNYKGYEGFRKIKELASTKPFPNDINNS